MESNEIKDFISDTNIILNIADYSQNQLELLKNKELCLSFYNQFVEFYDAQKKVINKINKQVKFGFSHQNIEDIKDYIRSINSNANQATGNLNVNNQGLLLSNDFFDLKNDLLKIRDAIFILQNENLDKVDFKDIDKLDSEKAEKLLNTLKMINEARSKIIIKINEFNNLSSKLDEYFDDKIEEFKDDSSKIRILRKLNTFKRNFNKAKEYYSDCYQRIATTKLVEDLSKNNVQLYITPTILDEIENHIDNERNQGKKKLFNEDIVRGILKSTCYINTNNMTFNQSKFDLRDKLIRYNIMKKDYNSNGILGDATIASEGNILGINVLTANGQDFVFYKGKTKLGRSERRDKFKKMIEEGKLPLTTDAFAYSVDEYLLNEIYINESLLKDHPFKQNHLTNIKIKEEELKAIESEIVKNEEIKKSKQSKNLEPENENRKLKRLYRERKQKQEEINLLKEIILTKIKRKYTLEPIENNKVQTKNNDTFEFKEVNDLELSQDDQGLEK